MRSAGSGDRWDDRVEHFDELQLVVNASDSKVCELMTCVASVHPHDVPEIVVLAVEEAAERYAKWVDDESSAS